MTTDKYRIFAMYAQISQGDRKTRYTKNLVSSVKNGSLFKCRSCCFIWQNQQAKRDKIQD